MGDPVCELCEDGYLDILDVWVIQEMLERYGDVAFDSLPRIRNRVRCPVCYSLEDFEADYEALATEQGPAVYSDTLIEKIFH